MPKRLLIVLACFLSWLVPGVALASAPRWIGPLPETAQSSIFAPIVLPGTVEAAALRKAGYIQEEYLLSGEANIYGEQADGSLFVKSARNTYVTRLVVVRPRDPRRFNGIVQLGFNHPQFAGGNWAKLDALVLRTGMAYAMLMIGGDAGTRARSTEQWPVATPLLFKWYDPARYAAFSWPDDDGVRWDVIGQAATLLRDPGAGGPLAGLKVRRLYASGWSFLGSLPRTYINFGFHDRYRRADGSPVIDGYLIGISAGSVRAGHIPLNSVDPDKDRNHDQLRVIDSPVIELTSEMEAITNVNLTRPESDTVKGGYRIYELGGVSHRNTGIADQARPATAQLIARGHPGVDAEAVCRFAESDVPLRDVAQAALVNLDRWVATGKAPPRSPRLEVLADRSDYRRDSFGNPLGGIRVAQLDLPIAHYALPAATDCGGTVPNRLLYRLPASASQLAAAYPGGRAQYLARFKARQAQLVREGWLLPADALRQTVETGRIAADVLAAPRR